MKQALLSARGTQDGLWPGGPRLPFNVPSMQGVLGLRASCLPMLVCEQGSQALDEACEAADAHIRILSPNQAEAALRVRAALGGQPL